MFFTLEDLTMIKKENITDKRSSLSFLLKALNTKVKTKLKVRNFLKLHKDYILRLSAGKKSF